MRMTIIGLAFERAGMAWDDALVVSGSDLRRAVNACRAHPKVAVLAGPGAGPAELGRALHPQVPRTFVVCEGLGSDAERIVPVRPAEATTRPWNDPDVVIVYDPRREAGAEPWLAGARPGPPGWALPDDSYEHSGGVHPPEVRAWALARLGPRLGDLVWDLGSDGGSVAIECARLGAAVVAVGRDEEACARVRRNVRAHRVKAAVSRGGTPEVLDHLPTPDAVFVGDGGLPVVKACAPLALRALTVTLPSLDDVGAALEILTGHGYAVEAVELSASPVVPQQDGSLRLRRGEPVFVVSGTRQPRRPDEAAADDLA